jgi:hypothetical protein
MTIGKWAASAGVGLVMTLAATTFSSYAQDPGKADSTAKKKYDPSRRVPDHFAQVGLTAEQRESIYKIRKTHLDKIEALRKQIADHEAESMKECEALLTDTQKKLLENLRAGGTVVPASTTPPAKTAPTVKGSPAKKPN